MEILSIGILIIYSILILYFVVGFNKVSDFIYQNKAPKNKFSIVVPFRNEANNLPTLLKSLTELNYPENLFELLVVNDGSTDNYNEILNRFKTNSPQLKITLLQNKIKSLSPKKDAVELAIEQSNFEWIVTTDADCLVPKNWLNSFDAFIHEKTCNMIVAPVAYSIRNNFLNNFQNLDLLSLQGTTIGSFGMGNPFLCNGANLCYQKQFFFDVNGFEGNNNIASGDDVFLMEKFLEKGKSDVQYLKSDQVIVHTQAQLNWNSLVQQRVRWAAKTSSLNNSFTKIVGMIVFTANLYLIFLLSLMVFNKISWQHLGLFYLVKFNIDFILLYKTATYFNQQEPLKSYLFSSFLYPFFNVYVALLSFFKGFEWKERQFKR